MLLFIVLTITIFSIIEFSGGSKLSQALRMSLNWNGNLHKTKLENTTVLKTSRMSRVSDQVKVVKV